MLKGRQPLIEKKHEGKLDNSKQKQSSRDHTHTHTHRGRQTDRQTDSERQIDRLNNRETVKKLKQKLTCTVPLINIGFISVWNSTR